MFQDKEEVERILSALGDQLDSMDASIPELVVCGGSALNVLGLVSRTTKDIDVVAFAKTDERGGFRLTKAAPFSAVLAKAAGRVERDFDLPENWLNPGPTSAVELGLPQGLMERVKTAQFGQKLVVHFLSRYDQICFKLYAAVDQGPGKHFSDLLALEPTAQELEEAARWSMTHDVSEEYRQSIVGLLHHMGYGDVADRL